MIIALSISIIIILTIIIIILHIRLRRIEKLLKIENFSTDEAIQNIASVYANKDGTMIVNNLQVDGKITSTTGKPVRINNLEVDGKITSTTGKPVIVDNLQVDGNFTAGGQKVLKYNDHIKLKRVSGSFFKAAKPWVYSDDTQNITQNTCCGTVFQLMNKQAK